MHPDIRVVPASVSGENGALVFVGQHLLAVLVHLEQEFYEQRDCWHVEASFFRHVGQPGRVFPTLFAAVTWSRPGTDARRQRGSVRHEPPDAPDLPGIA